MAATNGHTVYVGTTDGLYLAEPNADGYSVKPWGFQGQGEFRAPVLVDCDDASTLYAGTTEIGMFRSRDAGKTWQEINSGITHKSVWSTVQDPRDGTLYLGTSPANVYVSHDRGDTWAVCKGLGTLRTSKGWTGPTPPHVSRMKGLAITTTEAGTAIYGAIEEGWAVRSLDGGETWEQIDAGVDHDAHWVATLPTDASVLLASTGKGMFRSTDRGEHWEDANEGIEGRRWSSAPFVSHASRPGVLMTAIAATGPGGWRRPEGGDCAFIRSEDGGKTWKTLTQGLPQPCVSIPRGLAIAENDPDVCFSGMMDGTLWMTKDAGDSFEKVSDGLPGIMSVTVAQV
jgi:photosystem II stability/assembly factor-like uncharacterized protein